jgi:hypothetical protein
MAGDTLVFIDPDPAILFATGPQAVSAGSRLAPFLFSFLRILRPCPIHQQRREPKPQARVDDFQ